MKESISLGDLIIDKSIICKAKATTGEDVQGEFIHSKHLKNKLNEFRIRDVNGVEHDIDINTLVIPQRY